MQQERNLEQDKKRIQRSAYFDSEWYCHNYPDVKKTGIDPLEHFLIFATILQRNPSPAFSTRDYIQEHPEVDFNSINPLVHYLEQLDNNPEMDHPVDIIKKAVTKDTTKLKQDYQRKKLHRKEDTFALVRIIGNDLYPRHKIGQTRENLRFILENEPQYPGCTKLWIVNRIVNPEEHQHILDLLKEFDQEYRDLPFIMEDYAKIHLDTNVFSETAFFAGTTYRNLLPLQPERAIAATYRWKNNYVMNNNGARNEALRWGKERAKWALPWDGNCYLTPAAWQEVYQQVTASPWFTHFVVPMARMHSNQELIDNTAPPEPLEEPQLIFRSDTTAEFNPEFCYGRRPKVEMFWALGIPGKWNTWNDDLWDQKFRKPLPEAYQYGVAGWIARLYSGMGNLEQNSLESFKNRGRKRQDAILDALRYIDKKKSKNSSNKALQIFNNQQLEKLAEEYRVSGTEDQLLQQLIKAADAALQRPPISVTDKTTLPPSGDPHDYWHPAPYWWPNPETKNGLPYIRKDGERVPGTEMYDPESDKYDRTRIQHLFDDSLSLALAWKITGNKIYAEHAVAHLQRFFIDPATRMNPSLDYAQVRCGHNNNRGSCSGIIEMKDLYYYLDAVRLLEAGGLLSEEQQTHFADWLRQYQQWLLTSPMGIEECQSINNHGTYYDLQLSAIASYLGDESTLYETLIRAQSRIAQQFTPEGEQPDELKRTTTAHYCCFNLQAFLYLCRYAQNWGIDLYHFESKEGCSIKQGIHWLLSHHGKQWPYPQIDHFDDERFYFIYHKSRIFDPTVQSEREIKEVKKTKAIFSPHYAVYPWWNIS